MPELPTKTGRWERVFTMRDQELFARLSGDHNPMHVDPVAARRLMLGGLVVHALNTLTWSLERLAGFTPSFGSLLEVKATFPAAVLVDDPAVLSWSVTGDVAEATVTVGAQTAAFVEVRLGPEVVGDPVADREIPGRRCHEVERDKMPEQSGSTDLEFSSALASQLLPNLSARLPAEQLAVLLATTRIVGMRCPGLHSLYSRLNLTFEEGTRGQKLDYRVTRWDPRSGLTTLGLDAPGVSGSIGCLYRPAPAMQPSMREILAVVERKQFAAYSALIVGGSRGLGELTAKLIAAGGGDVMVTYVVGRDDADRLAHEVSTSSAEGAVSTGRLDVLEAIDDLPTLASPYTHVFYFATPKIRSGHSKEFDADLHREYLSYYVAGADRVLDAVLPLARADACFVWPSTIFVDEPPEQFREYVAAKVEGETWCSNAEKDFPDLRFLRPRLPRLKTDQTESFQSVETEDNLSVVLALCAQTAERAHQ